MCAQDTQRVSSPERMAGRAALKWRVVVIPHGGSGGDGGQMVYKKR